MTSRVAWSLWALAVCLTVGGLAWLVANGSTLTPNSIGTVILPGQTYFFGAVANVLFTIALVVINRTLVYRRRYDAAQPVHVPLWLRERA